MSLPAQALTTCSSSAVTKVPLSLSRVRFIDDPGDSSQGAPPGQPSSGVSEFAGDVSQAVYQEGGPGL